MGITNFPKVTDDMGIEELRNLVAILIKEVEFLANGGIDSHNIREVGGYKVNQSDLKHRSGIVGMNGANPSNATEVRFWAGHATPSAAPFKVQQDGKMFATGAVIQSTTSGQRVIIDPTGLHAYDNSNVERITIGTTPAKGAKALITRDSVGTEQGVYTYDTETVDGASRTGQYVTAHGAYLLLGDDGDIRLQASAGHGFRSVSGTPEINDGFGWSTIAKRSEAGNSLTYNSGTKNLSLVSATGTILSTVNLT